MKLTIVTLCLLAIASAHEFGVQSKLSAPGAPRRTTESLIKPADVQPAMVPFTPRTSSARGGAKAKVVAAPTTSALLSTLLTLFYFAMWYALNIYYNILNKKVLNTLPAPLIVGGIQFGVGYAYAQLLWTLRLRPRPVIADPKAIQSVGFWHCLGQEASMISLGAGPVSFTHIVKALEPFFSAAVAVVCFGQRMRTPVYLTLLPVVGGVAYACLKERSFSWLAFWAAMVSNLAFALRAVLSKQAMTGQLSPPNMFAAVTGYAFLFSIPLGLAIEGQGFGSLWTQAIGRYESRADLIQAILISGLFHYLNNEVMYLALGQVHPVTLAVGNTMKRVFIMVASVMVFGNPISLQAGIGSAIGISGVLLYSLTKQHYEKIDAELAKRKTSKKKK